MFKEIKNTNGFYSCDTEGNIKSNERLCWNGKNFYKLKERILKPYKNNKGYLTVDLRIDNKTKKMLVHRLIAETFLPNPYNLPIINHKDNNPLNNSVSNLEWCNYSYNNQYSYNQGRHKESEKKQLANKKPSVWLYKEVVQLDLNNNKIQEFTSITEAAKSIFDKKHKNFNSIKSNISACCKGKAKSAYDYIWRYKTN